MFENKLNHIDIQSLFVGIAILLIAFLRVIPHVYNFSPVIALAIFGAIHFKKQVHAYLTILFSLIVSDIIINNFLYNSKNGFLFFYEGFYWQYFSYFLIILMSSNFRKNKIGIKNVTFLCLSSTLIFFAVSNLGFWISSGYYPYTIDGLTTAFIKAIPFYQGTLFGAFFYTPILFGGYYLLQKSNRNFQSRHLIY